MFLPSHAGRGQEMIPQGMITPNGVQGSVQSDPTENNSSTGLQYDRINLRLNATASAVYNDNIYIQPNNKTSDLIWTISPGFTMGAGDYQVREESWLTLDSSGDLPCSVRSKSHARLKFRAKNP
jgi:hypothetical protein